jgi:hypothetical protein
MNNRIIIEFGHTLEEYKEKFGQQYDLGELWDISIEDAFDGAIDEENLNGVYWLIDGRLYEIGSE